MVYPSSSEAIVIEDDSNDELEILNCGMKYNFPLNILSISHSQSTELFI